MQSLLQGFLDARVAMPFERRFPVPLIRGRVAIFLCTAFMSCAASLLAVDSTFESAVVPTPSCQIDKLIFRDLKELKIQPVLCSDAVFVRRVYLDLLGTLPTAQEARDFINSPDPLNKRRILIDRLLERDEFADYWAMKWGDVLRIKAEFPVNLWPNAAQAYHRWVRASIAANKPYDQFARELLTASGSNFRVGPVNFYRAIQNRTKEGIATAVALTFMGTRADAWPAAKLTGMSAFFAQVGYKPTSEWKEEIVFWDPLGASSVPGDVAPGRAAIIPAATTNVVPPVLLLPPNHPPVEALFPDGTRITLPANKDPREVFADWLITPRNPWFTRAVANRIWYWLMGRGVIHEPDDIRPDNPPGNPSLMSFLENEMISGRYDVKRYCRLILNSQAYQLSSIPQVKGAEAKFASYPLRRLDAEVLIDAINKITGETDLYTSPIPEPFTYIPEGQPAVALPDGSITSPFLALFGRSARATGMENERNNKPVPAQWLYLLNSSSMQRKIVEGPKLKALFASGRRESEIIEELYLTTLSRFPTPDEVKNAEAYGGVVVTPAKPAKPGRPAQPAIRKKRREDWADITWALINSTEFLYRH